ncbi:MAG TPA: ATP-grasp domain-containing protein [Vicinamibacterales bacterium]|jgi:D-alanine-D-alanine ligase|nr:ATP-grasp domain-containing protein [Vicinamibacterales bacterium]
MKKLRVLVLMHHYLVPPDDIGTQEVITAPWRTEYDVLKTVRDDLEHDVHALGVKDDLAGIRQANDEFKPHIAFNLLEAFHEVGTFDQNVVSYLELLRLSYTGCNPRGMLLARDKALSKKLLQYHRIAVPDFHVVARGRRPRLPRRLAFPLIVKSLTQEASIGISQASVVDDETKLRERVQFIHDSIATDAIVERYIEGRELYCGVIGNQRLQAFPVWEMFFENMPESQRRIATERVKWNAKYQQKMGILTGEAEDLPPDVAEHVQHVAKRVYKVLELSGYARIDLRLGADGHVYVLEANPNPQIARGEDFASSAEAAGIDYPPLLQRILTTGLRWEPDRLG